MKREPISYEEKYGYENPLERDFWSDRATKMLKIVVVSLLSLAIGFLGWAVSYGWI